MKLGRKFAERFVPPRAFHPALTCITSWHHNLHPALRKGSTSGILANTTPAEEHIVTAKRRAKYRTGMGGEEEEIDIVGMGCGVLMCADQVKGS